MPEPVSGNPGAGAPSGAPAPSAPTSAPPSSSQAPSAAPAPSQVPGQGTPPSESPSGAQATPAVGAAAPPPQQTGQALLAGLGQRGSQEYVEKYYQLSPEDRQKVEAEITNPTQVDPNAPKPDEKPPERLPGDAPLEPEEVFVTEAELATFPPNAQTVITAMQAELENLKVFTDPKVDQGLQVMFEDPIIKHRLEEYQTGRVWDPASTLEPFKVESVFRAEDFANLDPIAHADQFNAKISEVTKKAHDEGVKKGTLAAEYKAGQQVAFERRKAKFEGDLNSLMDKHQELRPKSPVPYSNTAHPLNGFVSWAGGESVGDAFIEANGMEAAYAAFLAKSGTLGSTMQKVAENTRLSFIRKTNAAVKEAVTVGRDTGHQSQTAPQAIPGVDMQLYVQDQNYARSVFAKADLTTRQKLERFKLTGKAD